MIIIADSGSTKTDWSVCSGTERVQSIKTQGINPYHMSEATIREVLEKELMPLLSGGVDSDAEVIFYGAGCANDTACGRVRQVLANVLGAASIQVHSDLLGAARALCGRKEGIACVLGTGSNSCLYDGQKIVNNVPPMGYILGDEGSSAFLGRRLLRDCFKNQLPDVLRDEFLERYKLNMEIVLERVYRQPLGNRFLAGFTPFLSDHREVPEVHLLLVESFTDFLLHNVKQYHRPWLAVNSVGSVAAVFERELKEAVESLGMEMGMVMQNPMRGLLKYHEVE